MNSPRINGGRALYARLTSYAAMRYAAVDPKSTTSGSRYPCRKSQGRLRGATECRRHGNVPRHDRPAQSPPAGSIKRAETIEDNKKNAEGACWGRKPNMGIVVQSGQNPGQDQGQNQGIPELAEKVAGAC